MSPDIKSILSSLYQCQAAGKEIVLAWIPSHMGISGNEEADLAANQAATELCPEGLTLGRAGMMHKVRISVTNEWRERWRQSGNYLTQWRDEVTRRRIVDEMTRRDQVVLNRVSLGHTRLTHVHYITKEPTPLCPHCNERLDVDHLIFLCPLYEQQRVQCNLTKTSLKGIGEPSRNVIKFIKDIGLFADF